MTSRFDEIVGVIGTSLLFGFMFLTLGLLTTYFPLYEHVQNERKYEKEFFLTLYGPMT